MGRYANRKEIKSFVAFLHVKAVLCVTMAVFKPIINQHLRRHYRKMIEPVHL